MHEKSLTEKLNWAFSLAIRDARGSRTKALLYAFSMALGIGALVAMGSLSADLSQAVDDQTKELVGADLTLRSRAPFSAEALAFMKDIPGEQSDLKSFASMAHFPRVESSQLCRVRAINGTFPFYGTFETQPESAAATYRDDASALVDASLMDRLELKPGDDLRLGNKVFKIAGSLERLPGDSMASSMFGPRVLIDQRYLEETGLLQTGSRVFYTHAFKTPPEFDPDAFAESEEAFFKKERMSWNTVKSRKENLGEAMANLANYLNLIACLALLLGGLGVAGAVHYHIKRKTKQIATLRCLGATTGEVMLVYLIQVALVTFFAIGLGIVMGMGLQFMLPTIIGQILPVTFTPHFQPVAIITASTWGLLMSMLMAMAPLLKLRRISPLACFRITENTKTDSLEWLAYGSIVLAWWLFAIFRTASLKQGSIFIAALLVSVAALMGVAVALGFMAKKFASPRLPFSFRHSLSNLFRPHNQTRGFLVILGMGAFLVTILASSRAMLMGSFEMNLESNRPNFMAFDIQRDQVDAISKRMSEIKLEAATPVPIVPMRLASIKGVPIGELKGEYEEWSLVREYRSTYRADMTSTEELIAGDWVSEVDMNAEIIPISLEEDIAKTLKVELGDQLGMDVLGVTLQLKVASIRKVDWQSMQPNFFLVFPRGILEEAPQMFVLTARTSDKDQLREVEKALANGWPNVSFMDMTEVVETIDDILNKAGAVVRFLAALCILTGFVLLASAIWNSRYERMAEWALLRTLGATRQQMTTITLLEYFLLGLFASLTGVLLAAIASWGLGTFLFKLPPFPDPMALLPPFLILPPLTLILGYLGMFSILRTSPRYVLKEEEE